MEFVHCHEEGVDPATALARGRLMLERVTETGSPAALLHCVSVDGKALVLGRWQRAEEAVRREEAK
ncbi:MAG: hypothetical protein KC416_06445, partial [Myxococcales bacterium]|nr:hypothetical protein [Myxococcales bacterium]